MRLQYVSTDFIEAFNVFAVSFRWYTEQLHQKEIMKSCKLNIFNLGLRIEIIQISSRCYYSYYSLNRV